jgi:hypothetical protein
MVCFENAHVLNCRSERASVFRRRFGFNPWIPAVIFLTQAVHVGAMFLPGLRDVLGIAPVSLGEWIATLALAGVLILAAELYKRLRYPVAGTRT